MNNADFLDSLKSGQIIECPKCGAIIQPGKKFCRACGTPLSQSQPVEVPASTGTNDSPFRSAPDSSASTFNVSDEIDMLLNDIMNPEAPKPAAEQNTPRQTATPAPIQTSPFTQTSKSAPAPVQTSPFTQTSKSAPTPVQTSSFAQTSKPAQTPVQTSPFTQTSKQAPAPVQATSFTQTSKPAQTPVQTSPFTQTSKPAPAPVQASNPASAPAKTSSFVPIENTKVTSVSGISKAPEQEPEHVYAFAQGLPSWSIVPPSTPVKRRPKK